MQHIIDPDPDYGHGPLDGHKFDSDPNGVCRHPGCGWWDRTADQCPSCGDIWEDHLVLEIDADEDLLADLEALLKLLHEEIFGESASIGGAGFQRGTGFHSN